MELPQERSTRIVLPAGAALRVCQEAEREWGAGAVAEVKPELTRVYFWLGGRRQFRGQASARPVGAFWVRWNSPSLAQATIERIGWDAHVGGSEVEVRQVIDLLAGWPVATQSTAAAVHPGAA